MKKLYFLFFTFLITSLSFGQVINEFQSNPPGTDPATQSFELKGTPSASFSGYILSIESDAGTSAGLVDRFTSVSGTFDANGLLVVSVPDLENPSFTIVLVSDFTGDNNTDIDTDNDGVVDDTSTFGTVYDAIGIPDTAGEPLYGAQLGGADFASTGFEPELVFRDGSTGDWFAVNVLGTDTLVFDIAASTVPASSFDIDPTIGTTFGTVNPSYTATASIAKNEIAMFSVFPNPITNGRVYINTEFNAEKQIQVFDILGKQVMMQTLKGRELNVSSLHSGVYILKVMEDGKTATRKLIIN